MPLPEIQYPGPETPVIQESDNESDSEIKTILDTSEPNPTHSIPYIHEVNISYKRQDCKISIKIKNLTHLF